jgi:hypothetical protein
MTRLHSNDSPLEKQGLIIIIIIIIIIVVIIHSQHALHQVHCVRCDLPWGEKGLTVGPSQHAIHQVHRARWMRKRCILTQVYLRGGTGAGCTVYVLIHAKSRGSLTYRLSKFI